MVDALAAFFQDRSKDNEAIERELMALEGEQSSEDETPAEVETIASRSGAQKGRRSTVGSARKRRRRTVLNDSTGLLATSLEENPDVASAQRKSPRLSTLIKFSPSAEGIEDSAERRKRVIMEEIRDRIKQKGIGDEEKSAEGDSEEEYHVAPVSASKQRTLLYLCCL